MDRRYTLSTTWFVIFLSMISLIAGRSRMAKSSGNNATSTDVSGRFQNAVRSIHSVGAHNSNVRTATKVNSVRTASLTERKHKAKSNRKPRRNRRRRKDRTHADSNKIIRETMIHVLGFNSMPTRPDCEGAECRRLASGSESGARSDRLPHDSLDSTQFKPHPPNFMLELYRSYSEDKDHMILQSKSQGNTVRSFFPSPANSRNRETNFGQAIVIAPVPETGPEFSPTSAFLYNVTLIPALEDLVAAEIRLDGSWIESDAVVMVGIYKKRTECGDGTDCEIFTKVGKTLVLHLVSDKTWTDRKLAKLTKRARRNGHVLIVKFVAEPHAGGETASQRTRRHFEKDSDLPQSFVPHDEMMSRDKRSPGNADGDSESLSPMIPILIAYCNDPRASSNPESFHAAPVIWKALENATSTSRVRRSDGTGRAPPPADSPSPRDIAASKPKEKRTTDASSRNPVLVVEKRKKGSKRKRKKNRDNTQLPINGTQIANDPQARRQSKRNRNRGKRGRRRNKARKHETIDIGLHSSLLSEENSKSCERRSLTVSFADIGWSSAIITPKNFEAYYCSGRCDLPDHDGETKATNHAVIQSVVRNIGGRRDLPSPCCVPDKLMPLSVLYFDQDSNVVLKVFPNMSVETCGCR